MIKNKVKFDFSTDFQFEILKFLIKDKDGGLVIKRIKPSYLVLIEHSIIAEGLYKYYKEKKVIPSENVLKEVIKGLLESKNYVDLVTKEDIPNIFKIVHKLYQEPLRDRDFIKEKIYQFSTYIEMKNLNDSFDLSNFEQYSEYSKKVDKILQRSKPKQDDEPLYLIKDTVDRQFKRQAEPDVIPSPSKQLNDLTNAGGYPKHSIIVLLDKPKAKKTFFLVNMALGYLKMKKSVLYIDLENGKSQIMDRVIQSSLNKTKKEIYSGMFDKLEQKHIRKLSRFGVELVIQRLPAKVADCNTIKELIHKLREQGIDIQVLIIDFAAKLASIDKDKEDVSRIDNVYIDAQNLAEEEDLDCIWTANHITREGKKHRTSRYDENDIAGAVSIIRNVQCVLGLNATQQEEEEGIQRLELILQRDGKPSGRALFKVDIERQKCIEFTREQRKEYDNIYGDELEKTINKQQKNEKAKESTKSTGDI